MNIRDRFILEVKDGIGWISLARPDKRNVMDGDFFEGLVEVVGIVDKDPEIRVVVIKGDGKSFTAGLDLTWAGALLMEGGGVDAREKLRKSVLALQHSNNVIERCLKPFIAAVHSHCIGGGIDLLAACDIRLCTEDAIFSIRETKLAIIADLGTLQRLPAIVGQSWYRELALTGRDFFADEALKMGFVTRVLPDKDALFAEAGKLAAEIAALPPLTVQGVKDVANFTRDYGVNASLAYIAQKNAANLPSEDLMEAVTAFMQKRKPLFKGK